MQSLLTHRVGFLIIFVIISLQLLAQPNLSETLPVDSKVKIGKLSNGLTYYIRKNERPEKKVELRLVVNAGSVLEDDDQQGLAHFTEHMAFNGSKNFKKNDIVSYLQSIGVEFGADLNAYTSFEETVYILPIPTEKKENVEKGFQILEDWASTISFIPSEIDKERGVVLEEERVGKGAEDRMFRVTYPKLFEGSKYANRLPIGKPEVLKTFKPEVIKRFYSQWYRPDLMAVVVVGDFDPAEAERLIKKHFEKLINPKVKRERPVIEVPARTQSEALVVTDKEATNHVVEIHHPYKPEKVQKTVQDYRDNIVRTLFRSMLAQRMQELTQQADPPFIFGSSSIGGWARGYEAYSSFAYVSKRGAGVAIEALIQENERARKHGFTPAELERTKKMMMKSMERSYNERDKTESHRLVEEYIRHFLVQEPIPGIENEYKYFQTLMDGITLAEVNKKATETIPPANEAKLIFLTGPEKADFKIPTKEELLSIAEHAQTLDTKPYEEKVIASSLLEKEPTAGKIVSEKKNSTLGTTELNLSNGVRVILKPTDFKNDQIVMVGSRFGGQYLMDVNNRINAEYASTIVSQMGIGQFSPTDLRKALAGKSASVSTRIGGTSESVNGQCSVADIETLLQLTHLNFTQPRKDDVLFQSFVGKQQTLYQNMVSDPQYVFQDSILHTLYGNHPWAPRLPKADHFASIKQDDAIAFYKQRFSNADEFTFIFVGAIDVEKIKPILEKYIASLPATDIKAEFKDIKLRPVKGVVKKAIEKGKEQKSMIRLFWNGEAPYSETENLKLQAFIEIINLKITETLREDLSGIYGGGMYGSLNKYPYNAYSVGVSLPCGPDNVNKLISALLAEIDKIKSKGAAEADLNKVKETWRQQYLVNIKDNGYWARQLLQAVELGSDPNGITQYESRINSLTTKDIQDAARKYIDMNNFVQIVLNPEK